MFHGGNVIISHNIQLESCQTNWQNIICLCFNCSIHSLHDFSRKQESQLHSSVLVTVWRVVIEKGVYSCDIALFLCPMRWCKYFKGLGWHTYRHVFLQTQNGNGLLTPPLLTRMVKLYHSVSWQQAHYLHASSQYVTEYTPLQRSLSTERACRNGSLSDM